MILPRQRFWHSDLPNRSVHNGSSGVAGGNFILVLVFTFVFPRDVFLAGDGEGELGGFVGAGFVAFGNSFADTHADV